MLLRRAQERIAENAHEREDEHSDRPRRLRGAGHVAAAEHVERSPHPEHKEEGDRSCNQDPHQDQPIAPASAAFFAKYSSAVRVFVCCSVSRSTPFEARNARVSAATWNASPGSHFVDSSKIRDPSG
jgi:hypothetical protein